jgi:hypothetical protein
MAARGADLACRHRNRLRSSLSSEPASGPSFGAALLHLGLPSGAVPTGSKSTLLRMGRRVTRHPRMGAVEEPEVTVGERVWNERPIARSRENAGVYRLLCVNVHGISD